MGVIEFNGISSRDLGIEVETFPTYDTPEKEYQVTHVPGRNGDLLVPTGTYKNVPRSYKVSMATYDRVEYYKMMNKIAEWLYSSNGYARLEDSYTPEYYSYAYYDKSISIENLFNEAGRATLTFTCKPQRYLKIGEYPISFTSSGTLHNQTDEIALPVLKVVTNNTQGAVGIGNQSITIKAGAGTNPIIIDSELQDAWSGATNKNSYIVLTNGDFISIKPGNNAVTLSGGIQSVEVTPRWWTV
jgi:predicted phage tail component-like protein